MKVKYCEVGEIYVFTGTSGYRTKYVSKVSRVEGSVVHAEGYSTKEALFTATTLYGDTSFYSALYTAEEATETEKRAYEKLLSNSRAIRNESISVKKEPRFIKGEYYTFYHNGKPTWVKCFDKLKDNCFWSNNAIKITDKYFTNTSGHLSIDTYPKITVSTKLEKQQLIDSIAANKYIKPRISLFNEFPTIEIKPEAVYHSPDTFLDTTVGDMKRAYKNIFKEDKEDEANFLPITTVKRRT